MCLAFPGRITEINGDVAKIDFGGGTTRDKINISYVDVKEGDYVLIHAGYAIQSLDMEEATNMIKYWQDNNSWKCNRCDISDECSNASLIKQINSKSKVVDVTYGDRT
ncbi:MAG TPA: HypC/HybG/HupF family hydrogenase formation chaperone [Nitrososphaeraceae archaeon]|nr:HypC/HybG/HupF family hydrogenase formation chaperone [Nitrososphaeraceae archaeon]